MPVPALRALIFAALVDDPDDETKRATLHQLIEDLVASGTDNPPTRVLATARQLIRESVGDTLPFVLDPFCGGGSTLVEAQRLGLAAVGSDLNPIPVLMSKALTELPPTVLGRAPLNDDESLADMAWSGLTGFLADVRHYANRIYTEAQKRIGHLYPVGPNGDVVSSWIWARTVESPDPRFQGCHVPLVSNWWLSKRAGNNAFIRPVVDGMRKTVSFEIAHSGQPP